MIKLNNVSKVYRTDTIETTALHHLNLNIEKGEFISIMGPSGCGKSTLLNIVGLLDEPTQGKIIIDGNMKFQNITPKATAKFRNEKLGFIFQSFHLIPDLSVLDNVELPLLYRNIGAKERRELALEALESVNLINKINHYPSQLSGGQKQRVAIARAIVGKPSVLLADEPTGNLDSVMGNDVMSILLRLNEELNTTIVMVTHDENMAHKTHKLLRLFDGKQVG
ncbi:MAG: ABC transporter ATP-binding protein [Saprospiraceae bacterium]|nr:ABC transporter ATP-binding protein [Candidatus Brachybacter algidus]